MSKNSADFWFLHSKKVRKSSPTGKFILPVSGKSIPSSRNRNRKRLKLGTLTSTHQSFQYVSSTQGHLLLSPLNPFLPHESSCSTKIRHFHTNPSVSHKFVTSTRIRQFLSGFFTVELKDLCWTEVCKWRIWGLKKICPCESDVLNWRVCGSEG